MVKCSVYTGVSTLAWTLFVPIIMFSYKMLTQKTFLASWLLYPEGYRFSSLGQWNSAVNL